MRHIRTLVTLGGLSLFGLFLVNQADGVTITFQPDSIDKVDIVVLKGETFSVYQGDTVDISRLGHHFLAFAPSQGAVFVETASVDSPGLSLNFPEPILVGLQHDESISNELLERMCDSAANANYVLDANGVGVRVIPIRVAAEGPTPLCQGFSSLAAMAVTIPFAFGPSLQSQWVNAKLTVASDGPIGLLVHELAHALGVSEQRHCSEPDYQPCRVREDYVLWGPEATSIRSTFTSAMRFAAHLDSGSIVNSVFTDIPHAPSINCVSALGECPGLLNDSGLWAPRIRTCASLQRRYSVDDSHGLAVIEQ